MNPYQSPEQAAEAEKALANMAEIAAKLGPQALWRPPDPAEVEREKAEKEAQEKEEDQTKRTKEVEASRQGAVYLKEFSASTYLATIAKPAFGDILPPAAMQIYRTSFLRDTHVSSDPIEQSLVEQFMLLHHTACKLLGMSCDLTHATVIGEIGGVAARFLAEARRLALAIQAYRQAGPPGATPAAKTAKAKSIKPAAAAETNGASSGATKKKSSGAKVRSNGLVREPRKELRSGSPQETKAQSTSRCRRSPKSSVTGQLNGRRPRTSSAKHADA